MATVLQLASLIREGHLEDAKRLVDSDHGLASRKEDSGRSLVHLAAVAGMLPLVQLAVHEAGVHPDEGDDLNWSPLMLAASAGRLEVVRFLLGIPSVNVSHANVNGQTSLHYAASKGHKEIIEMLLSNGIDVNHHDKYGATALHRAASQGRDDIVSILCQHNGINVDPRDGQGNTPL